MNFQSLVTTIGIDSTPGTGSGEHTNYNSASFDGVDGSDLTKVTPTSLYLTSNDSIIIGGWLKPSAVNAYALLIGKPDLINYSYAVASNGDGTVGFYCRVGLASVREIDSTPTITNGTKYFFVAWKNLSDTTINLKINANAADSLDYHISATIFTANAGDLFLGGETGGADPYTGLLDEVFVCLNPADISAALTIVNTNIYNSGTGIHYTTLTTQQKTDLGLVSWWGLDETSGNRLDLHGSNHLTVQGNVTAGTSIVP